MKEEIDGQEIVAFATLGSKYDEGHLINAVMGSGEICRISVNELVKLVNGITFTVTKKRKYNHLTVECH